MDQKKMENISEKNDMAKEDSMKTYFSDNFRFLEKRINDQYKVLGIIVTLLVGFFIVIGIFNQYNYNKEKESLKEFKEACLKKIDEVTNGLLRRPKLEILGQNGQSLEGQIITGKIEQIQHKYKIRFVIRYKNTGNKITDDLYVIEYFKKPVIVGDITGSDEVGFDYQIVMAGEKNNPSVIPPGASVGYTYNVNLKDNSNIEKTIKELESSKDGFPVLLKIFYGGETPAKASFILKLKKNYLSEPPNPQPYPQPLGPPAVER